MMANEEEFIINTPKHFQVDITIFKVKDLKQSNVTIAIDVIIGNKRKTIKTKIKGGDHTLFHRHLKFLFFQPYEEFLKTRLELRVRRKFAFPLQNSVLGVVSMELASVWTQPQHHFVRKKFTLMNFKSGGGIANGYLECNIEIITEFNSTVTLNDSSDSVSFRKKKEVEKSPAHQKMGLFKFLIYRGDGFVDKPNCDKNLYVKVSFAGTTKGTQVSVNTTRPVWNEALSFFERLPTLYQNINVEVWDKKTKNCVGSTSFSLKEIAYDGKESSLPLFGPTFLYLYMKKIKNHTPPKFVGRILMSLTVEKAVAPLTRKKLAIKSYNESVLPPYQQYLLVLTLYHAIFFHPSFSGQKLNVNLQQGSPLCGPEQLHSSKSVLINIDKNNAKLGKTICLADEYSYLNFSEKLLVLHTTALFPSMNGREAKLNYVRNLIYGLNQQLNAYTPSFLSPKAQFMYCKEFSMKIKRVIDDFLKLKLEEYATLMEKNKKKIFEKELKVLNERIIEACKGKRVSLEELRSFLSILKNVAETFAEDVTPSFPDILITLSKEGSDRTFYRALKAADYMNSESKLHGGALCGKKQTINLRDPTGNLVACLEGTIWFGRYQELHRWKETIPIDTFLNDPLDETEIVTNNSKRFQLRAYLFQGRLKSGFYALGLADPFVRVLLAGEVRETQVKAATLNPKWDETLVFSNIVLSGDNQMIKCGSLGVVFEVLDHDRKFIATLIGRGILRPRVLMAGDNYLPLKLQWEKIYNYGEEVGEVLIAMELLENIGTDKVINEKRASQTQIFQIPDVIRPHCVPFTLEVLFWGVRNYNSLGVGPCTKTVAYLECDSAVIYSEVTKPKACFNFPYKIKFSEVLLPKEVEYFPPICVTLMTINAFNKKSYKGSNILNHVKSLLHEEVVPTELDRRIETQTNQEKNHSHLIKDIKCAIKELFGTLFRKERKKNMTESVDLDETIDWWTKYYAAKQDVEQIKALRIYKDELENQPEFDGFQDFLQIATLSRRNKVIKANDQLGILKYSFRLHPLAEATDYGMLHLYPSNAQQDITVRVYVICAYNLTPPKENHTCNPYVIASIGLNKSSNRENYAKRDLNPLFGILFEFKATLPYDHSVTVRLIDRNAFGENLIGFTEIDIENRFYTKHRANCGLPYSYEKQGDYQWRDYMEPTEILQHLCTLTRMPLPEFHTNYVRIGGRLFVRKNEESDDLISFRIIKDLESIPEFGFQLVPEHVETRSLFHPRKPHIDQGKVEMWIDIFPGHEGIPPITNITPRKPVSMELRVIIWGVSGVTSAKGLLFAFPDLFVRGWLTSSSQYQQTDTHSETMSGEATFNWRFIFPFEYSPTIKKLLVTKKGALFEESWVEKLPCELCLQLWDNELVFKDCIGALTLNLGSIPVGSKNVRSCNLKNFDNPSSAINLFKVKRARAWWPFRAITEKQMVYKLAGKVDLELQLLTKVEAQLSPAGIGREGPNPLPKPIRPNFTTIWMFKPIALFIRMLCRSYGKLCLLLMLAIGIVYFILVGVYSIPGYTIKKILNT